MIKCKNCTAEIPPQWVAAINSGICPGCGGDIFLPEDKELLDELRAAMEQMEDATAESIAGWILSNYELRKIGSVKPTEFHRMRSQKQVESQENIKIADNPVHKFLQRTGYAKQLDNRKRLKEIVNDIDSNVKSSIYEADYDPDIDLDADFSENYSEDEYIPPTATAKQALANSSIVGGENASPPSQEEIDAMTAAVSMAGDTSRIEGDLPPALQLDRLKRLQKQQEVSQGGGKGIFRRGG